MFYNKINQYVNNSFRVCVLKILIESLIESTLLFEANNLLFKHFFANSVVDFSCSDSLFTLKKLQLQQILISLKSPVTRRSCIDGDAI